MNSNFIWFLTTISLLLLDVACQEDAACWNTLSNGLTNDEPDQQPLDDYAVVYAVSQMAERRPRDIWRAPRWYRQLKETGCNSCFICAEALYYFYNAGNSRLPDPGRSTGKPEIFLLFFTPHHFFL